MKNLKKVLAMVLAFACTFSMFAGAKVFEDVPAGSDYSEAITMLSDLGVIQGKDDGKYHPEDTITRAEACAMIARLMTGDPNVSQYVGAQSFTDVAKGSWKDSAIGYCYINGIVIGVGNNKFEPDRAITDAEFVTMVVRAMGYETADMKQNYPFSYMSNAQAIGLLDGTNMVASTDALRGEDAQVIYNALFADYARGAKLVNTTHGTSVESYPTLAESVWGLERAAAGTWKNNKDGDKTATLEYCKAHTWVVLGADPENEGNIIAYPISDNDGELYVTDKDRVAYSFKYDGDASAVAGYQVELWGEGSHGEPEWDNKADKYVWSEDWTIKAIKTVKGQTAYDYNASMADSKEDNGEIVLGEETLDLDAVVKNTKYAQEYSVDQYVAEEYNGYDMDSDKNVEKALNVRDGAQYKLMDWDSDGDIDWVVVSSANYYKVEAVSSSRVTVSAMKAGNEETSTASDSDTWKLGDTTTIDGTDYKFVTEEDLAEGDIIEVTYAVSSDDDKELVTATITKVESETAELDKVSTKDTLELTFNGEVKKIAEANVWGDVIVPANPAKYEQFDDEELGTEFALWTNRNGFIVYSDYSTDTSNYLMVLDTGAGSDKTGDRKLATMDVLYADNSVKKDVEVISDLELDGYFEEDTTVVGDGTYEARSWDEKQVVGNVYKYWMNEDGVITKMEPMIDPDDTKNTKAGDTYYYDESADRLKTAENGNYVASLEEAKVIFAVIGTDEHGNDGYIEKDGTGLKVDAGNVLAVKQSDIPEIGADEYTKPTQMVDTDTDTWLNNKDYDYIADVNGNGEATAAVLGVNSFNKFNAASTNVGLVTSVSYDKNDVVEIEVAYKGEVTTVKSAEKVDFDDVVKAYDYNATTKTGTDKDLSSPKDTLGNDLTNEGLATYLKDNAAYAEITTNADGVLTNVTFMDKAGDNTVIGHYYQVSRNIIGDINGGNVAYGNETYRFYDDENLYSVGRLEVSDKDLADDVYYYTIDGTPTINGTKSADYTDEMLSVLNGFDGTPDIKAESESNLSESYVNNKYDKADTYEVADLVSKIGTDGEIVAAYTFEDALGEYPTVDKVVLDQDEYSVKAPVWGAANESVTIGWDELGDAKVASVEFVGEQPTGVNSLNFVDADNEVTVTVTDAVAVDEIKLSLKDAAGKELAQVTVKVTKDAENTLTVTPVVKLPTLTALSDVEPQKFAEYEVKNAAGNANQSVNVKIMKDGKDVTALFDVTAQDGELKIGTETTTPAGPATVVISKAGYPTYEMPIDVAKATATVEVKSNLNTASTIYVNVNGVTSEADGLALGLSKEDFVVEVKPAKSNDPWKEVAVSKSMVGGIGNINLQLATPLTTGNYEVRVTLKESANLKAADAVTGTVTVTAP